MVVCPMRALASITSDSVGSSTLEPEFFCAGFPLTTTPPLHWRAEDSQQDEDNMEGHRACADISRVHRHRLESDSATVTDPNSSGLQNQ